MREELLEASNKLQFLRAEQERQLYEKDQEAQRKCEKLQQQLEAMRKAEERKL